MPALKPSIGQWVLPQPDHITEPEDYIDVPRFTKDIPFGYEEHPDDPLLLKPVPLELDLLAEAKKHLNRYSYRDVAAWLSAQSGRYISFAGLRKRIKNEQSYKRRATAYRRLAEHYGRLIEKAEEYEAKANRLKGVRKQREEAE